MENLAIIGGDERQRYLAGFLNQRGFHAQITDAGRLDPDMDLRAVVLPLPATRDGKTVSARQGTVPVPFAELVERIPARALLLGGLLPREWIDSFTARGGRSVDYYTDGTVALRNALPTAEGALRVAMESLPVTLSGSRVAVVGYGRIGALLTEKLIALGAGVSVLARSPVALTNAALHGAEPLPLGVRPPVLPSDCRAVFNTVPARVLTGETFSSLPAGCVLIELASAPGGFDVREATDAGMKVVSAPGIPGKFYPETAGGILADAVCNILRQDRPFPVD